MRCIEAYLFQIENEQIQFDKALQCFSTLFQLELLPICKTAARGSVHEKLQPLLGFFDGVFAAIDFPDMFEDFRLDIQLEYFTP